MSKAESRIPEKGRIYEGEQTAEMLVNWLNHTEDEAGKERIKQVVALYIELWFLCQAKSAVSWKRGGRGKWVRNHSPEANRREELEASLNSALGYYRTQPSIWFVDRMEATTTDRKDARFVDPFFMSSPVAGSAFARNSEEWRKTHRGLEFAESRKLGLFERGYISKIRNSESDTPILPGSDMAEMGAIRYTLALLESGYIFKIRRCRCEKFFFQRFSHQRFCSEKCRITEFRTSDEARLKRNAYARKLYQLHKTKNVK